MGSLGAMQTRGKKTSYSKDRYFQADVPATTSSSPRASRARSPTAVRCPRSAYQLVGGLRQSMFYVGARTIDELKAKGKFVRITAGRAQGVAPARRADRGRGAELQEVIATLGW